MATIVLDPGHGGQDPGAVNGTRLEKDDNLRLGLALRAKLQAQGQRVVMTRSTDKYVSLNDRSAISNCHNTCMFVSLHRNAFSNGNANGVETLVQTNASPDERRYAQNMQNTLVNVGVQSNRGVKSANLSVLRNTNAPAMMVELGFISNAHDNYLYDHQFDTYAEEITRSILKSLGLRYRPPYCPPCPKPYPPCPTPYPPCGCDPAIADVQRTLNRRYNTGLVIDGKYGSKTQCALVIGLQTELNCTYNAGLVVDGVFGPCTQKALEGRSLQQGSNCHNMVYILQAALCASGYPLKTDGTFGSVTDANVRTFQRSHGLVVDGLAGPNTFNALLGTPIACETTSRACEIIHPHCPKEPIYCCSIEHHHHRPHHHEEPVYCHSESIEHHHHSHHHECPEYCYPEPLEHHHHSRHHEDPEHCYPRPVYEHYSHRSRRSHSHDSHYHPRRETIDVDIMVNGNSAYRY